MRTSQYTEFIESYLLPMLNGCRPSTSFEGGIKPRMLDSFMCDGSGNWTIIPEIFSSYDNFYTCSMT